VRKLYFQSGNTNTSFKLGKQIVVWGEAEGGIITDIISPRDSTEFIFTQIEDTRVGQYMLTVDNYSGYGQVSFILNPDSQANIYPEKGHKYAAPSFDTMDGFDVKAPYESANILDETEVGTRWKHTLKSIDISLMGASVRDNNPVYRFDGISPENEIILTPVHERYEMLGASSTQTRGYYLISEEIAYKFNKSFNAQSHMPGVDICKKDVLDTAISIEYNANGAWDSMLSISNSHINNFDDAITGLKENLTTIYLSWTKNFLYETLTTSISAIYIIQNEDMVCTPEVSYDINDSWSFEASASFFAIDDIDSQLACFKNNHRIAFESSYKF